MENRERQEKSPRLSEEDRPNPDKYGWTNRFPQSIHFQGRMYDPHGGITERGTCVYRMTSEARIEMPEPSYIEVDEEGYVVKQWK